MRIFGQRSFTFTGVALICASVTSIPELGRAEDQVLSLSISTNRQVVTAGDDIPMQVTLKNLSEKEIPIGHSDFVPFDYDVEIVGPAGNPAPESKSALRWRNNPLSGPVHWIIDTLAPGAERIETFDMEDFADLSAPGAYSVQLLWPRKTSTPFRSNVVVIMVESAVPKLGPSAADILASAKALHPKPTMAPLSLTIDTDRLAVLAGKPIGVAYELTNKSNHTIRLSPGTDDEYAVEARDEKGVLMADRDINTTHKDRMARDEGNPAAFPSPSTGWTIPPGQKVTSGIEVDRYVDLSKPGIYSIQCWRRLPKEEGSGEVRSNVIVVIVKP
jgi:hypothetical protein